MATQRAFYVDAARCIGCDTCSMACRNQYHQEGTVWRQIYPLAEEIYGHRDRAYVSLACNHCEVPSCLQSCPTKAYYKREDGVVVHEPDKCIGCKQCIRACPFGAPRYSTSTGRVGKCSLCYQRLDDGKEPACVQACPTGALSLIDLSTFDDPEAVRFPPGFPEQPKVKSSTRFKLPRQPRIVRRTA